MKQHPTLTIFSLVTIVLTTFHLTHDALHQSNGMSAGDVSILLAIMLVMLYGTVELAGRRAGFVIMFLGGLAGAAMIYLHSAGPRAHALGLLLCVDPLRPRRHRVVHGHSGAQSTMALLSRKDAFLCCLARFSYSLAPNPDRGTVEHFSWTVGSPRPRASPVSGFF